MRVVMNQAVSGTRNGVRWPSPGEPVDLPDHEAADLVAAGLAHPAPEPDPAPRARKAVKADVGEKRG